ncbi:hypothetical protein PENTCL1PPCAC_20566, partial [Pristionchus entomophagus]
MKAVTNFRCYGFPGRISYRTRLIVISMMLLITSICGPILNVSFIKRFIYIFLNYTSGFSDDELNRVDCYETILLFVFIGYSMFIFSLVIVFFVMLSLHIFILLRSTTVSMSDTTRGYH